MGEIVKLTPDEITRILKEIHAFSSTAGESLFEVGNRWIILHDGKADKIMGCKTFSELIKAYTHYSRSWVYTLMDVARTFGKLIEMSTQVDIEFTRLRDVMPLIKSDEDAENWFRKANSLPDEGWRDELREAKGLITSEICLHKETISIEKCKVCGKYLSVTKGDK